MHLPTLIPLLITMTRLPVIFALFAAKTAAHATKHTTSQTTSMLRWLIHLGGPSLILLGLIDNSFIPLPGSTDVVDDFTGSTPSRTVDLLCHDGDGGSVLGGYLTYRMARKGGKETLEKRFSQKKVRKVYAIFERWGFASVAIPALLPPPFPIVPMLLAAGALQCPTRKFLTAKFFLIVLTVVGAASLHHSRISGYQYGRNIVTFFDQYYWPVLIALFALFEYWADCTDSTNTNAGTSGQPVGHRAKPASAAPALREKNRD